MGKKQDSFADRLWGGIDDAFESVSPEGLIDGLASSLSTKEPESDYGDYTPAPLGWSWQKTLFLLGVWAGGTILFVWLGPPLDKLGVPVCPAFLIALLPGLVGISLYLWARDKWDVLE